MDLLSRVIALIFIIILFPFFSVVALLSFLFQGSPIIYKQKRVGYKFTKFEIYKFRTMVINSGNVITQPNDNRVTFFGKIMRSTKFDEIPQLFNIVKGDMRFIGPRPEVPELFDKNNFQFLNIIKPGISDYSSIFFRNESKILQTIGGNDPYKILLPVKLLLADYYSKKKSFFLDLKLLVITIITITLPLEFLRNYLIRELLKELPELKGFFKKYLKV